MSIIYNKHNKFPESILIRNFAGDVDINEILKSWKYLMENDLIDNKIKGVINNISECNLQLDMNSFQILIDFLEQNEQLRKLKLAVICTDPKKIIFPILGENNKSGLGIKTFSTMDAAETWIKKS